MTGAVGLFGGAKILSLVSGGLGYVLVAAGASGATYWVTSRGFETELANLRAERAESAVSDARAALAQFVTNSGIIADAAATFKAQQTDFQSKLDQINSAFSALAHKTPLPSGCAPTADRMRSLEAAINAANSAISRAGQQPRGSMPITLPARRR